VRDALLLGARAVVGGYLAVHGAQKLFGAFDGPGLDKAGAGFERLGLTPGKQMAALAGAAELGGGLLTVTGLADPAGPMALIGSMGIAAFSHRANGPMASKGGYELPLTDLAAAAALAAAGPGRFRLSPSLPRALTVVAAGVGAVLAGASVAKMVTAERALRQDAARAESSEQAVRPASAAPATSSTD
jgi:putative oxidoreductase